MKIYFDFGLIQILNSVLILEHLPATVLSVLKNKGIEEKYNRIASEYSNNPKMYLIDTALSKRFLDRTDVRISEVNAFLDCKKL